jgi:hypothetical protein
MENIADMVQIFLLIVAAIGGFRKYILQPYFDTKTRECKWQEELEKMKEEKRNERDKRIELIEKAKEDRQTEREKKVEQQYQQLAISITDLTNIVRIMKEEDGKKDITIAQHEIRISTLEKFKDSFKEEK